MGHPFISIVIPAYNAERYIGTAIESVLQQTFVDFEIIVIDDGSTDCTKQAVERFGDAVKYFVQKNKGPAAARNLGIKYAKGTCIAFLDADDWWLKSKLETEISAMQDDPEAAFVCSDYFCGKSGDEERRSTLTEYEVWNHYHASFDMLLRENFVNTSTILVAKNNFVKSGLFNESLRGAEDRHLWLRLLQGKHALVIKEILAFRRYHTQNTSSTLAYNESQLAMVNDLLSWPIIKQSPERKGYLRQKKNELQLGLGIRAARERRYGAAAQIYWNLFIKRYMPVHCFIRFASYAVLSKVTGYRHRAA